jgi:hypothetical protein
MREFTSEKTNLETLDILANTANIPESSQNRQTSEFVRQATRHARRDLKQVQKDADILCASNTLQKQPNSQLASITWTPK